MVLYQKKKRVKPFLDPDGKTLLYGSFRPVNGQSINNFFFLSFPKVVVGNLLFVVAVILESCSPGSVVTQKEENNRYRNTQRNQTSQYDFLIKNHQTTHKVDSETSSECPSYFITISPRTLRAANKTFSPKKP